MNILEKLQGAIKSKTIWLGNLLMFLGVLQTQVDWVSLVGTKNAGVILSGIAGAMWWLRFVTDKPLEKK